MEREIEMKLYLVNNTRKLKKVKKILEEEFVIEEKENLKFKMTKNDYVIVSDEEGSLDGLENLKNIIILVNQKSYQYIWKLASHDKTIDIIDNDQDENYIANRIKAKIS